MQNENLTYILVDFLFLDIGKCCGTILCYVKIYDKRALGMPNHLKIQLTYVEQDPNIALNLNYKQFIIKRALEMTIPLKVQLMYVN